MRNRFDGFTAEKRKRFLKTLGKTGCFSDAARVAGVSRNTAMRWRSKDARFARDCDNAIEMASSHIEALAWERAVTGIEEPVWHYGKLVGTRVKRSDAIFRLLLMASNRKKYGRMGALRKKEIERRLRDKIEAEVRAKVLPRVASNEEVRESLIKALTAFGQREAEARALEAAWDEEAPPGE